MFQLPVQISAFKVGADGIIGNKIKIELFWGEISSEMKK